jgi:hypothetical protein
MKGYKETCLGSSMPYDSTRNVGPACMTDMGISDGGCIQGSIGEIQGSIKGYRQLP